MRYQHVHIDLIEADPRQPRNVFTNISELAESISRNGLLENLVVRPHPENIPEGEERFILVAGERRWLALRGLYLEGKTDGLAFCLIVDEKLSKSEILFRSLAENVSREEIPSWVLGHRFQELLDAGYTQLDIAMQVGKTGPYIARCCQIAFGLHPDIEKKLNRIAEFVSTNQAFHMCKLVNDLHEPDLKAQQAYLTRLINSKKAPKPRYGNRVQEKSTYDRIRGRWKRYLAGGVVVPPEYREAIDAFVAFLEGKRGKIYLKEQVSKETT